MMLGRWRRSADPTLREAEGELDRLRAGDPAALTALIGRHHGSMLALARSILRDAAAAEDATQEAWIAVMAGLPAFEGRSRLSTWILAILVNKARSHARREGRYVALAMEDDPGDEAEGPERFDATGHWRVRPDSLAAITPERILAGREALDQVRGLIDQLPPAQRAVLVLRDVEGESAAETAALLGLSDENQRVLLHRARTRLRRALDDLARQGGP